MSSISSPSNRTEVLARMHEAVIAKLPSLGILQFSDRPDSQTDLTGIFCTSGSGREFTLEGSWYAHEEIQAGADRDAAAAG